jgi:hypothetical protein
VQVGDGDAQRAMKRSDEMIGEIADDAKIGAPAIAPRSNERVSDDNKPFPAPPSQPE